MLTPTNVSNFSTSVTPAPDQQVYFDPDGWYSVFFPADMQPTDRPNVFSRAGDILETGYLAEMGYMSNVLNVCAWLANIALESPQNIVERWHLFSPNFSLEPRCAVSTDQSIVESVRYEIFENPAASPEHRFVYIKTSWNSFATMNSNIPRGFLSWLKPITPRQEPAFEPLDEAELSLWKGIAPVLEDVIVTEYPLPPGSDPNQQANLLREIPENALPDWFRSSADPPTPTKTPTVEEQLKTLGYMLNQTESGWKHLFRDDRLLFDDVISVSTVYTFSTASGPLTAFLVNTKGTGGNYYNSFLIQNDTINAWEYNHQDPRFDPVLHENEILWLKASKDFNQIQIIKSDQGTVFSFSNFTEPLYSVNKFTSWNGQWILAARDFLVQNGEIINETLGFEEIFNWGLVDDKPIYLFRKGPRIGISYDGKILPLEYQDVARYLCCGYASNNPDVDGNGIHFFGKRNGIWYYVVIDVK